MRSLFSIILYCICLSSAFSMENVFYISRVNKIEALTEMAQHLPLTHIIIAQAYHINGTGNVSGTIDADVVNFAKKNSIKLFALVTNTGFDAKATHQFLIDPIAQDKVLAFLMEEVKKNNLAGLQLDFEMLPIQEKNALTLFYQKAADLLHKNNRLVSFAIAPTLSDNSFPTQYQKKLYDVWQGVYDIKKLGEISDFVTIMAYDQHGLGTTPGPTASVPWGEQVIKHALTQIPANKISFGIPTYSGMWYLGMNPKSQRISIHYNSISFQTLSYILKRYKPIIRWDDIYKVHYTFYDASGINKFIFIEDAKSFDAKYLLAKKYQLRGISVFRLGIEDPAIWNILTDSQKQKPWIAFW